MLNKKSREIRLKIITTLLLVTTLTACANKIVLEPEHIKNTYRKYIKAVQKNSDPINLLPYWSQDIQDQVDHTSAARRSASLDNISSLLYYPRLFNQPPEEVSDAAILNDQEGCILVLGKTSQGDPLAMQIKMVLEKGQWKHEHAHAIFYGNGIPKQERTDCNFPQPPA